MSEKIPIRVQHRRMTKAEWESSEVILLEGEFGVESDTGYAKIGDGVSRFSALKYMGGPEGPQGDEGPRGPAGKDGVVTFESLTPQQKEEIRGPQGVPGRDGAKGAKGDPGPRGVAGAKGERGEKGADGKSATVYTMTQVQYDQLTTKEPTALYVITG